MTVIIHYYKEPFINEFILSCLKFKMGAKLEEVQATVDNVNMKKF